MALGPHGGRGGGGGEEKDQVIASALEQEMETRRRRRKRDGSAESEDPAVERRYALKKLIRDGKIHLIREDDVTEGDVIDKLDIVAHRQGALLKMMSRLQNAAGVLGGAEGAAGGGAPEGRAHVLGGGAVALPPELADQAGYGVRQPPAVLLPGEHITDRPLGGEQLALGRPAPEALDPMFDPKIPRPEDVSRATSKVKRGSFTSGVPSEDESLQRRPDAEDIEAARALDYAGAVAEEGDDAHGGGGGGAAPSHDGPNDDEYDGQSFGAGSAVSGVSYGSGL